MDIYQQESGKELENTPEDLDISIETLKLDENRIDINGKVILVGGPSNGILKKIIERLASHLCERDNREGDTSIIRMGTFSNPFDAILENAINLMNMVETYPYMFYDISNKSIHPAKRTKAQTVVRPMRVLSRNLNKHLYDRTKASPRGI